ncbi:hypothetical protein SOMG_03571 [Schizosaccharomyces osmophilus]|uniref:Uncharacterized protein n=1 Tax=Schizosaccharomyces osmophilus TaxID=2545709 RepID=A0AAF0AXF6_9SCHI|nr:uncharacterized protein SOMG_03571 [Schizosaccharomyces osmophilus]WBW74075.1 hypothetical protein SOMG_03571 [Schizosaccharomyces osmophilus]
MNGTEKEMQLDAAKPAESSLASNSSDSCLPRYSDNFYLNDLEKGCLCLRPILAPEYSEQNHEEDSMLNSVSVSTKELFKSTNKYMLSALWLFICPAKMARIPQAAERKEKSISSTGLVFFFGSITGIS